MLAIMYDGYCGGVVCLFVLLVVLGCITENPEGNHVGD